MNLPIFAERLSDLMFDKNIKSTELAKNLNCERSTINRYLNAHKTPTVEMLIKLANYFECSTDFLLGIEPENYAENYLSPIPFSQRLPSLLNQLKITRYQLQQVTGIAESTLYYWAKGFTTPTIDKIISIAKAFNISIDFVLGRIN